MSKVKLFSAKWCTNCTPLKKYIEENNLEVEVVDIDKNPQACSEYGVRGIPSLSTEEGKVSAFGQMEIMKVLKEL